MEAPTASKTPEGGVRGDLLPLLFLKKIILSKSFPFENGTIMTYEGLEAPVPVPGTPGMT